MRWQAFNSVFTAELVRNKGPRRCIDDLVIAVAGRIEWVNHRSPHGEIGLLLPAEFETQHYPSITGPATPRPALPSLH